MKKDITNQDILENQIQDIKDLAISFKTISKECLENFSANSQKIESTLANFSEKLASQQPDERILKTFEEDAYRFSTIINDDVNSLHSDIISFSTKVRELGNILTTNIKKITESTERSAKIQGRIYTILHSILPVGDQKKKFIIGINISVIIAIAFMFMYFLFFSATYQAGRYYFECRNLPYNLIEAELIKYNWEEGCTYSEYRSRIRSVRQTIEKYNRMTDYMAENFSDFNLHSKIIEYNDGIYCTFINKEGTKLFVIVNNNNNIIVQSENGNQLSSTEGLNFFQKIKLWTKMIFRS